MLYKTMVLELLKERTTLYDQLRQARQVPETLETLSTELKASHEIWKQTLAEAKPESRPAQIASEALEMALADLEARLPPVSPTEEEEPLSLDQAMAFIKKHSSKS
jgi:hypothetical protein